MDAASNTPPPIEPALRRRIARARAALVWEALWRASWPASGILALFVAASLAGLWNLVPGTVHALALVATLGLVGLALWSALRQTAWPGEGAAVRRIEQVSALEHRPLATLADRLAAGGGNAVSEALWRAHRDRAQAASARLRAVIPHPALAERDPWALRFLAIFALVFATALAGPDAANRLVQGFLPGLAATPSPLGITLDAWIDPPAYTGAPPLYLARGAVNPEADAVPKNIPAGSTLHVRVTGVNRLPLMRLLPAHEGASQGKPTRAAFRADGQAAFAVETALTHSGTIEIRAGGRRLARWPLTLTPDGAPRIAFTQPPDVTTQTSVRLSYSFSDDFGVTGIELRLARENAPPPADPSRARIELPAPGPGTRQATVRTYKDLTAHPWAGERVLMTLAARDAAGHEGVSDILPFTLPERQFSNPLAKSIVEARKYLLRDEPDVGATRQFLGDTTAMPEAFGDALSLYLALRSAFWRLEGTPDPSAIASTSDLLWDTALALEEGEKSEAQQALEEAKAALAEALKSGASDEEIERRLQALQEALSRYLESLAADMARPDRPPVNPRDANAQVVTADDLQSLLEAVGELSRTGARGEAQALLNAFDDILQNLQTQARAEPSPGDQAAQKSLDDLGGLIGAQRSLLDETFQRSQTEIGPPSDDTNLDGLARRQDELRRTLDGIQSELGASAGRGDAKNALQEAEKSMMDARGALQAGRARRAVEAQKEALENLRRGAQALAQSLDSSVQASAGRNGGSSGSGATDPFGRPLPGAPDLGTSVRVPDGGELRRARAILDEIRKRASERGRPEEELEYLKRLLERF